MYRFHLGKIAKFRGKSSMLYNLENFYCFELDFPYGNVMASAIFHFLNLSLDQI